MSARDFARFRSVLGRARALAVTSRSRMAALPELPTIAEAGIPGFEVNQWYGVVTTARVPRAIVDKLSGGVAQAVQAPDVAQRLAGDGSTPVGSSAEEFAAVIAADLAKWRKVIQDTGIVLN